MAGLQGIKPATEIKLTKKGYNITLLKYNIIAIKYCYTDRSEIRDLLQRIHHDFVRNRSRAVFIFASLFFQAGCVEGINNAQNRNQGDPGF